MSQRYNPTRTNRTPWTDTLTLLVPTVTVDEDGYETVVNTEKNIFCTFTEGVTRNEFFDGMKAGLKLSAIVECWGDDYSGEEKCVFNNKTYKVIRCYETGRGTVELSLAEEMR